MTVDAVSEMTRNALLLIIQVSLPVLLVSLIVGLSVSIFQTVTFVPKIICVFGSLILLGPWMMESMVNFLVELWSTFSVYAHR